MAKKPVHIKRVRNIIGFVPSKAEEINGWAVGWTLGLEANDKNGLVRINGLYTNAGPIQVLGILAFGLIPEIPKRNYTLDDTIQHHGNPFKHSVNGLGIGLFDVGKKFKIQGLQVNAFFQRTGKLNGMSITGLFSKYERMNGVMITALVGQSYKVNGLQLGTINLCSRLNGVQIGLINRTLKARGVQIGLWNQIGKWGLPFINFRP